MTLDLAMLQRIDAAFQQPERAEPSLERRHPLLRLTYAPSLASASYAWVIAGADVRRPGSPAIAREIRFTRGGGEDDGLRVRDAEVALATAEAWRREAAGIRIPVVGVARNMGCDGTTYTLYAESGFASVKMKWWCDGPGEWSELTAWARGMMERLHAIASPGEPLGDMG